MHPTKSKILREPFRFHFLGSSELTLRRDFAPQNARDAGLPAILFFLATSTSTKKESPFQALFSKIQSFTIWCFSDFPLSAKAMFTA